MKQLDEFSFTTTLDTTYEQAVDDITKALKAEGFGIITEIDVKETFKKKLDVDFRKYVILGACSPSFAFQTLELDLSVGLMLPCNVIVYETDDRKVRVSAINPVAALELIQNEMLKETAEEVSLKLKNAVERIEDGS